MLKHMRMKHGRMIIILDNAVYRKSKMVTWVMESCQGQHCSRVPSAAYTKVEPVQGRVEAVQKAHCKHAIREYRYDAMTHAKYSWKEDPNNQNEVLSKIRLMIICTRHKYKLQGIM